MGEGYRYGLNGKENDNEVKGTGNQQDYGFRIYDPRLGKFLSVDPLTKDYPWYTPYQFAGNMPIWAVDLDGAEPNPSNTAVVNSIYDGTRGDEKFEEVKNKVKGREVKNSSDKKIPGNPVSDPKHRFVNSNTEFHVDNTDLTDYEFTNFLLGHFIKGTGPENYVFPKDGFISNKLKNSSIVTEVMQLWFEANITNIATGAKLSDLSKVGKYAPSDHFGVLLNDIQVKDFVGSAFVTIKPVNSDFVEVTVFNVTSLHSGDLSKEGWGGTYEYLSVVRDPNGIERRPYSNISQIYKFTLPIDKEKAMKMYEYSIEMMKKEMEKKW